MSDTLTYNGTCSQKTRISQQILTATSMECSCCRSKNCLNIYLSFIVCAIVNLTRKWLNKQDLGNIYRKLFVYILYAVLVSVPSRLNKVCLRSSLRQESFAINIYSKCFGFCIALSILHLTLFFYFLFYSFLFIYFLCVCVCVFTWAWFFIRA